MSIEAMKLALEALEWFTAAEQGDEPPINQAITALRQAIEQAQKQEPVGRFSKFTDGVWKEVTATSAGQPLYAAPPQRQPLTDEEMEHIWKLAQAKNWGWEQMFRAIEAAHGIKGDA